MTHKGYSAELIELDEESGTIHGRVALKRGVATFEGITVAEVIQAFRDTVDDCLDMCAKRGVVPEEPGQARVASRCTGPAETTP